MSSLLASFLTPDSPASPNAAEMQTIYLVMLVVAVVIVVAINGALIAAVVRFRARRGEEPTRRVAGRRVIPRIAAGFGALALVVFIVGIVFTESIRDAERLGNVSETCRRHGVSRTVFYRWRQRLEQYGPDGVHPKRRHARRGRGEIGRRLSRESGRGSL